MATVFAAFSALHATTAQGDCFSAQMRILKSGLPELGPLCRTLRGGTLSQQREQRQRRVEISQRKSTLQICRRIGVEVVKRTSQRSISPVEDWTGFCRTETPSPSSKHFPLLYIYLSDTRHNSLKVSRGGHSRDCDTEQAMAPRARSFIRWRLLSVVPFRLV